MFCKIIHCGFLQKRGLSHRLNVVNDPKTQTCIETIIQIEKQTSTFGFYLMSEQNKEQKKLFRCF